MRRPSSTGCARPSGVGAGTHQCVWRPEDPTFLCDPADGTSPGISKDSAPLGPAGIEDATVIVNDNRSEARLCLRFENHIAIVKQISLLRYGCKGSLDVPSHSQFGAMDYCIFSSICPVSWIIAAVSNCLQDTGKLSSEPTIGAQAFTGGLPQPQATPPSGPVPTCQARWAPAPSTAATPPDAGRGGAPAPASAASRSDP